MSWRGRLLRLAAFAAGVALVAWLVRDAGPRRVLSAMDHALAWFPILVLLEIVIVAADFWASRALAGKSGAHANAAVWLRATALAYASSILLPAGRAAGEATRAALLSPAVGLGHASGTCTRLQAAALFANAIASTAIALTLALVAPPERILAWALVANAVACALGGLVLVLLLRNARFQAWLWRRFPRLLRARAPEAFSPERPPFGFAVVLALFAQTVQTVQYGVVARAVGGALALRVAMTAQGIHLVGALVGDAVPNQMGATEGAYRVFAHALGMEVPQALSIALVARAAQLVLACAGLGVGFLVARQPRDAVAR